MADERIRCDWTLNSFDNYIKYHDEEWGVPVHDDRKHFEFLILEGAQAGLSWATILKRREGYRKAFAQFDPDRVAKFTEIDCNELLSYPGIIRNRLKISSAIINAQKFLQIQQDYGSFNNYIWAFVDGKPIVNHWKSMKDVPITTSISDAISKDLKKKGFKFVGSTIIYSHMQACGLVNDHTINCFRHHEVGIH